MPHHNGFEATIRVDGQTTDEYACEVSADRATVTCWIASQLGKEFSVYWRRDRSHREHSVGYVQVDGNPCAGRVIYSYASSAQLSGVTTEDNRLRPFVFSSLETTGSFMLSLPKFPNDDALEDYAVHPDLGVIALTITPVVVGQRGNHEGADSVAMPDLTVHERAKKALTERVGLGAEGQVHYRNTAASIALKGDPIVTFRWKYRPIEVLRAAGSILNKKRAADEVAGPSKRPKREEKKIILEPKPEVTDAILSTSTTQIELKREVPELKRERSSSPIVKQEPVGHVFFKTEEDIEGAHGRVDLADSKPQRFKQEKIDPRITRVEPLIPNSGDEEIKPLVPKEESATTTPVS
ncbi:hypothetical protein MIND_00106300 [Mycena indigotica]|uniref:DUF7918 domain-containing protein n=1 Tax=Mycena indigotica TaxID=2126181 RepID=A0A8H6TFT0_9AGAR|nr:uncharacterized protein MIND_00106300 [Mycena indigotica]KAF7315897.1 hypothetical protein MIND_00106300 [Mycena indigotica]